MSLRVNASGRPRVLVVGAGFAGLAAAKGLATAAVDVTIIDANNFHTFQPLLYQVATAGLDVDDVSYAVRGILRRQRNAEFRLARVTGVDLDGRLVSLESGSALSYDYLIVAAGAVTADFGVQGADVHAVGLKNLADAVDIRTTVLRRFEELDADPATAGPDASTVVIVGGGPTGVELAGGMRELFTKVLRKDFPRLDVEHARVVLIEVAPRLLGTFAPKLGERAAATLRSAGVELLLGTGVDRIEPGVVHLRDGRQVAAGTIVWAAGVQAGDLATTASWTQTRGGRIVVDDDLSVPGHPEVFVVGDIAASRSDGGADLLGQVAQPAIQGGRHAARMIRARLADAPTAPFVYHDKGSMATIGRRAAVVEFPNGLTLHGTIGWLAWLGLHLLYLVGFRNRANVLVNWAWNYVSYDRGSRLIGRDLDGPRRLAD